jgi:uncharacterized membrane protein
MVKSRFLHLLLCFILVFTLIGAIFASTVSAQDATATPTPTETATPTPAPVPEIKLDCDVPTYSDNSGSSFYYTVNLLYTGDNIVTVNLSADNPAGWYSSITYSSKEVSSLPMGPLNYGQPDSKSLSITLAPNVGNSPEPGEYKLKLTATAGELTKSIDLTAVVKAKYSFSMSTDTGNLATTATAGKENHFSINLNNTGSAELTDINLSVSKPDNWTVTFNPEKVTSLSAGQLQQEDIIITPPSGKTVAGDYIITLTASNANVSSNMDVRVTVQTSSIWGVVSIGIIVVVIAGLAVLFLRLGRR